MKRKFYQNDRNGRKWPKMVCVIKDTADIYCFCKKNDMKHLLFKLPPIFLNKSRSSWIFLSKLWKIFLIQNLDPPPGKERWTKTRLPGSENVRIPGSRLGGWSGLGEKFNSMNILQHQFCDFIAEHDRGYTWNILVSQSLEHGKEMLCCQCE